MESLQERLQKFIASMDKSVLSFENQCGIAPGTVSKMTEKSRLRTLEKISKAYPQLNMGWLKTGEGEMLNPSADGAETIEISGSENVGVNLQNSKVWQKKGFGAIGADVMEIIKGMQRQIESLNRQIEEKDARIAQLTDRLLNVQE